MLFIYLFAVVATLFAGWRAWRRLRYFLHVFQLETYKPQRYRAWVREHASRVVFRLSHKVALGLLLLAALGFFWEDVPFWTALIVLPLWAAAFASSRLYRSDREKKPFAYTARMQRLLATAALLTVAFPLVGLFLGLDRLEGLFWYLLGWFVADFGAPLWVLIAAFLMQPVENAIQRGFKRQARRALRDRPDLTIVGITGSYGKTSTKFIIEEILSQKYSALATPSSYNTPMGLCLVINEKLKPEHQVLVLEYGIRYPGDMQELCEIARPDIAVITTVGVAHLESMGSVENIAREKGTLLEYLPPEGPAVLNVGDEHVRAMAKRAPDGIWRVSVEDHPEADLTASNLRYDTEGATFDVHEDDETYTFRTRLLGRHNVLNILLGAAAGRILGLRLRQIAHAVARLEPIEHRLELRRDGQITVIDDAFNSNPVGARNAVEILGQLGDGQGRRVIVTPGMIELGERQWKENKTFGAHIARHRIDLAVLIGEEQTAPIQEGLHNEDFPEDRLKIFDSLFEAQSFLNTYLRPGDVVLYENDLPDQYEQ